MEENKRRAAAVWIARKAYELALPLALCAGLLTVHIYFGLVVSRLPEYEISSKQLSRLGMRSGPISTLDDGSMKKIHDQLRMDPGVKKVSFVRRAFPAGFEAKVQPRAAWIAVKTVGAYVTLDDEAVRLQGEFRRAPATKSGLIVSGVLTPLPGVGRAWDDEEIRTVFEMARLVLSTPELRRVVTEIDVSNLRARVSFSEPEIVLASKSGCKILWGRAPSAADGFEPSTQEKLQNLSMTLRAYPSLSGLDYAKIYIRNRPTVRRSKPPGALNQG